MGNDRNKPRTLQIKELLLNDMQRRKIVKFHKNSTGCSKTGRRYNFPIKRQRFTGVNPRNHRRIEEVLAAERRLREPLSPRQARRHLSVGSPNSLPVVVKHAWTHVGGGDYMVKSEGRKSLQHRDTFIKITSTVVNFAHPMAMEVDESRHAPMILSMVKTSDLSPLFDRHRVLVTVGAGGVGKTTVAAALALRAAQGGKRTLCLTIDPARRLATSLGLEKFPKEQMKVPVAFLEAHGIRLKGSLTVMMLDPEETFDQLIRDHSTSAEETSRILQHRIYTQLSKNLSGTHSYMAMEKVLSVMKDSQYDLIVLDTPPAARTLEFFDAPRRMSEILDSPATRALVRAIDGGSRLKFGLVGVGIRRAIAGLERVTGAGLVGEIAEFLATINGLFLGFGERAAQVEKHLMGGDFGYILVTSPLHKTIQDALCLSEQMKTRGLQIAGLVINRTALDVRNLGTPTSAMNNSQGLSSQGLSSQGLSTVGDLINLQLEKRIMEDRLLEPLFTSIQVPQHANLKERNSAIEVRVPSFSEDVHNPESLLRLASYLSGNEAPTS